LVYADGDEEDMAVDMAGLNGYTEAIRFLPKLINGKVVLVPEGSGRFRIDNNKLRADTEGIAYRVSKDLNDLDPSEDILAKWGCIIHGQDDGNGWVEVRVALPKDRYKQGQGTPRRLSLVSERQGTPRGRGGNMSTNADASSDDSSRCGNNATNVATGGPRRPSFAVAIHRTGPQAKNIGLVVSPDDNPNVLIIDKVVEPSLISEYNKRQSDYTRVRVGDIILSVDGIRGKGKNMLKKLKSTVEGDTVKLVIDGFPPSGISKDEEEMESNNGNYGNGSSNRFNGGGGSPRGGGARGGGVGASFSPRGGNGGGRAGNGGGRAGNGGERGGNGSFSPRPGGRAERNGPSFSPRGVARAERGGGGGASSSPRPGGRAGRDGPAFSPRGARGKSPQVRAGPPR
jgi:hypothetical protein